MEKYSNMETCGSDITTIGSGMAWYGMVGLLTCSLFITPIRGMKSKGLQAWLTTQSVDTMGKEEWDDVWQVDRGACLFVCLCPLIVKSDRVV